MSLFTIDYFELLFLAEVCIPPTPIARAMFWERLCGEYHDKMKPEERRGMYEALKPRLKPENEDCQLFEARFNPENQYLVETQFEDIAREIECFKFKDNFHTSKGCSIIPEYIISIKPNFNTQ
ncbi:hypothetical protein [Dyadobacter sp. CY312]|uniref:hypothetical protein n=1 Tax=Dyadobacter sp. CY312 TaxID=2907303 RepID=UPI001F197903|nr:hypothetical protein [Dyadobacter sp. CY312]MCE7039275.1 hypothetical protein [Dyadobacter sp. CY312]